MIVRYVNNLACEYIIQTTSLIGLNISQLKTNTITATFEQTTVLRMHTHTRTHTHTHTHTHTRS